MKSKHIGTFEDVLWYLNNIEDINRGGCGLSALIMHRWLTKNKLAPFSFDFICVYFRDSIDRYITNQSYITVGKGNLIAPNHVLYLYNEKVYDSEGERSITDYDYSLKIHSEENLVYMINNITEWNRMFRRDLYIKSIERDLNISLEDIVCNYKQTKISKLKYRFLSKAEKILNYIL